jgi:hypothetical protein
VFLGLSPFVLPARMQSEKQAMTPRGGPLDEKYFRDVASGCVWILVPAAALFGFLFWLVMQ